MNKPTPKKQLKKAELCELIAEHLLAKGFSDSGIRSLAAAAGTSDRMLIYYFETKEKLIEEVLELIAAKFLISLEQLIGSEKLGSGMLLQRLEEEVLSDDMRPLLLFWFEIVGLAVRGEEPYKTVARNLMMSWQDWIRRKLKANQAHKAEEVFAQLEGRVLIELLTNS